MQVEVSDKPGPERVAAAVVGIGYLWVHLQTTALNSGCCSTYGCCGCFLCSRFRRSSGSRGGPCLFFLLPSPVLPQSFGWILTSLPRHSLHMELAKLLLT